MTLKNLVSDARLGLRLLFIRPIERLTQRSGIERFRTNFFPEGLIPTTLPDRALLALASRCIGCGLCDAAAGSGPSPSALPTVFSKASVDLKILGLELAAYSAPQLAQAERLCPTSVPLRRLAQFLTDRRRAVTDPQ